MDIDEWENFSNGYVNVPISMLKCYWSACHHKFDWLLINIIAFGAASNQLIKCDNEDGIEAVTQAAEDNIDEIIDFINEWDNSLATGFVKNGNVYYFDIIKLRCEKWIKNNGGEDWTKRGGWVGVTIYNLRKMMCERIEWNKGVDKRINPERGEQKWLIYFGLKSVIGQKKYFECSWNCILNRALGFISSKDYENANPDKQDWTIPFRTHRKTKSKMLERLINEFNLDYKPVGKKGCTQHGCRWSFKRASNN